MKPTPSHVETSPELYGPPEEKAQKRCPYGFISCDCDGTAIDHWNRKAPAVPSQEGAPPPAATGHSPRAGGTQESGGVPSCDSAELAAIRAKLDGAMACDDVSVNVAAALLRMVDELTDQFHHLSLHAADLDRERDELRAKLAEESDQIAEIRAVLGEP